MEAEVGSSIGKIGNCCFQSCKPANLIYSVIGSPPTFIISHGLVISVLSVSTCSEPVGEEPRLPAGIWSGLGCFLRPREVAGDCPWPLRASEMTIRMKKKTTYFGVLGKIAHRWTHTTSAGLRRSLGRERS